MGGRTHFTAVEGDYKKNRLSVYLSAPLSRESQTATALLPFMLERGTRALPDMTLLQRRLCALYGASMTASYSQFGFARVIDGYISGADGALLPEGQQIERERAMLLGDLLFDPAVSDGAFCDDWLVIEKEKLRETIQSVINDKREYCYKLLIERFYEGDGRSLPVDGFESNLGTISARSLYDAYESFLSRCSVEIIYVGRDAAGRRDIATDIAARVSSTDEPIAPISFVQQRETVDIVEEMDVEQDKLAFAFTSGYTLKAREMAALRVASALLGGTPTSRLFVNVREKKSLCYSISSTASYESAGGMFIDCGISHDDAVKARSAILHELENLASDGPTDKEMREIALTFKNAYGGVRDSSSAINSYVFNCVQRRGELVEPEMQLEELLSVDKGDVRDALSHLHLNCTCHISKKGGAER
ncbi:MAG: insulinase family protein [Oscillospiraceae bacterium]